MKRQKFSSGSEWEGKVGYSRAVKVGPWLEVAGTTAVADGKVVGVGDVYAQTRFILEKIEGVLKEAGFALEDVVRTRIYVTDIRQWREVGRAHAEFFKEVKPASSMVEVSRLVDSEMLVEIEVSAWQAG